MGMGEKREEVHGDRICEARTVTECRSEAIRPSGRGGPLIARLPVVIAQTRIHTYLESRVRLNSAAVRITSCKRDALITRCSLLDLGNGRYGKICINGYVREDMEYVEAAAIEGLDTSGAVRFQLVHVPFECMARVEYYLPPALKRANRFIPVQITASAADTEVLSRRENGVQKDISGPEGFFCELNEVKILEADIMGEPLYPAENRYHESAFDEIAEHMALSIVLSLLQVQAVSIPASLSGR